MVHIVLLLVSAWLAVGMAQIPSTYKQIPPHGAYRVSTNRKTWQEAELDCENDGFSTLAVINSVEESRALKTLLQQTSGGGVRAHVGFEDKDGDGQFRTVSKGTLSQAGFDTWKNEPSHAGQAMCGTMWICGRLGETECANRLSYICEYLDEPDAV